MTIHSRLLDLVSNLTGHPPERLQPEMSLVDDLDVDSLAKCEFTIALERVFDVSISDDDAEQIQTLGDALAVLQRKLGFGPAGSADLAYA